MGHRSAESKLETEAKKLVRLLTTAIERMGDAAANRYPAQALDHLINRTTHMKQNREIKIAGDL